MIPTLVLRGEGLGRERTAAFACVLERRRGHVGPTVGTTSEGPR